jgi:cyanophycin synthetase
VRATGIVGVPGDRSDELIEEAGRVAARGFSRLVIKEDVDLRGRAPGEVAELLRRTVEREAPGRECHIVLDEQEALGRELARLAAGEVVVMFYDKLAPLLRLLEEHGAEPVNAIDGLVVREENVLAAAAAATAASPIETRAAPVVRQRRATVFVSRDKTAQDWQGYIWR